MGFKLFKWIKKEPYERVVLDPSYFDKEPSTALEPEKTPALNANTPYTTSSTNEVTGTYHEGLFSGDLKRPVGPYQIPFYKLMSMPLRPRLKLVFGPDYPVPSYLGNSWNDNEPLLGDKPQLRRSKRFYHISDNAPVRYSWEHLEDILDPTSVKSRGVGMYRSIGEVVEFETRGRPDDYEERGERFMLDTTPSWRRVLEQLEHKEDHEKQDDNHSVYHTANPSLEKLMGTTTQHQETLDA